MRRRSEIRVRVPSSLSFSLFFSLSLSSFLAAATRDSVTNKKVESTVYSNESTPINRTFRKLKS